MISIWALNFWKFTNPFKRRTAKVFNSLTCSKFQCNSHSSATVVDFRPRVHSIYFEIHTSNTSGTSGRPNGRCPKMSGLGYEYSDRRMTYVICIMFNAPTCRSVRVPGRNSTTSCVTTCKSRIIDTKCTYFAASFRFFPACTRTDLTPSPPSRPQRRKSTPLLSSRSPSVGPIGYTPAALYYTTSSASFVEDKKSN